MSQCTLIECNVCVSALLAEAFPVCCAVSRQVSQPSMAGAGEALDKEENREAKRAGSPCFAECH
jgi:hypothetical protein